MDNVKALVTVGELGRHKEVHDIVLPRFDKEYANACVIEGEEVPTLRFGERRSQKLFVYTSESKAKMATAVDGRGLGGAVFRCCTNQLEKKN